MTDIFAEIIGPDLLVVLVIVAVLFGGSRLPKLARSLGSAKNEFEKGIQGDAASAPATSAPRGENEIVTLSRTELDALLPPLEPTMKPRDRQPGSSDRPSGGA